MNVVENQANPQDAPVAPAVEGGQFFVRLLTGKTLAFSLNPDMTIAQLKGEIQAQTQIPVDQQRLVFQGKQLEDANTLRSYEISDNANLHLVLRLRGGQ